MSGPVSIDELRDQLRGLCARRRPALLATTAIATLALIGDTNSAFAACSATAPVSGQTVTCDTAAPNPTTTPIEAVANSSNVTINVGTGSTIAVVRSAGHTAAGVFGASAITNSGTLSLTGAGSSGLNRGAALLGLGNGNNLLNSGSISTTGQFNDGMAADGSGNTLTNNGTIKTTGPNAYGMTASWGQSGGGQPNNTLINNGSVTTSGGNARAVSILGQNGVITNTGSLTANGSGATAAYMQGNNDRLTNSGIIHATGANAEGVFSNTAGSGFTATIENLSGGQIISDLGPAIRTLNGATTITNAGLINGVSGTALNGGIGPIKFILRTGSEINGLANGGGGSNLVQLEESGTITNAFSNFQTLKMEGTDWTWNGSGTFADTFIDSGTFRLQSSLTGNVNIAAGTSLLAGDGANPSITPFPGGPAITVTNAGLIDLTNGAAPAANSLTIAGNYVGSVGAMNIRTTVGADNSPSDKLVISGGTASGLTNVAVTNFGGSGGLTVTNGIMVVEATNGATTAPTAFALNGGSIVAGAYQYYLFHGGVTAGSENNFYLRSSVPPVPVQPVPTPTNPTPAPIPTPVAAPNTPPLPPSAPPVIVPVAVAPPPITPPVTPPTTPGSPPTIPPDTGTPGLPENPAAPVVQVQASPVALYRPEVALYSAATGVARQLGRSQLGTFHDRQGDQGLLNGNGVVSGGWARIFGEHTDRQWSGMANPSFDGTIAGVQSGLDLFGRDTGDGHRDRLGLFAAYGRATGNVNGFAGGFQNVPVGSLALDATSAGGYWTHVGPSGWYVDGVIMHTWYTGAPRSINGMSASANGTGLTASLEGGYPIYLTPNLVFEPQAQLIYQRLQLGATQDLISSVSYHAPDAISGRIGARLQGDFQNGTGRIKPYLVANIWRDRGGNDSVTFAGSDVITTQRAATALEFGGGVVADFSRNFGVFAAAGYTTDLDGIKQRTVRGNLGLRVTW